jgi:hypothetical protein
MLVRARSMAGQVKVWVGDHSEDRAVKVGLRGNQYVGNWQGRVKVNRSWSVKRNA